MKKYTFRLQYTKGIDVFFYSIASPLDIPYILLNGKRIDNRSKTTKVYHNMLRLAGTVINIHISKLKLRKKHYSLNRILLSSIDSYTRYVKGKRSRKLIAKKERGGTPKGEPNHIKNTFSLFSKIIIGVFILLVIVFISDYSSITTKINQGNILKLTQLKAEYDSNKCEENGNLEALKTFCSNLKSEIDIIKTKSPTTISVFFIWFLDIFSTAYQTLGYSSLIITFTILLLLLKFA